MALKVGLGKDTPPEAEFPVLNVASHGCLVHFTPVPFEMDEPEEVLAYASVHAVALLRFLYDNLDPFVREAFCGPLRRLPTSGSDHPNRLSGLSNGLWRSRSCSALLIQSIPTTAVRARCSTVRMTRCGISGSTRSRCALWLDRLRRCLWHRGQGVMLMSDPARRQELEGTSRLPAETEPSETQVDWSLRKAVSRGTTTAARMAAFNRLLKIDLCKLTKEEN